MNGKYFIFGGISLLVLAGLFLVFAKPGIAQTTEPAAGSPSFVQQESPSHTCRMGSGGCGCKQTGSCGCSSCGCASGGCAGGCGCGCAQ
ncbi:MAG: hypothetical protein QW594_01760 [Candidatus Woesearchaeota archaeon]